ncbi:hypothetical protein [Corynebacterium urealyticum]|uniref:hypothetical protein n=1 Tax=Corynebacterium urealyticum TaxID=43771 RepID=UPI00293E079F|nr:hypothetical protein [Corynebacterium urealyticum]WOH95190.1 hypothetical protein RZ943_04135 [Corynebacterium urealyticum]
MTRIPGSVEDTVRETEELGQLIVITENKFITMRQRKNREKYEKSGRTRYEVPPLKAPKKLG